MFDSPDNYYMCDNFSSLQATYGYTFVQEAVSICDSIRDSDLVDGAEIIIHLSEVVRNETIKQLIEEGRAT